ncbi:MAG TPA: hypothetical protein VIN09_00420 [Chloroflexota bacterium]
MSFGDLWLSAALGVLYVLIAVPAALPRAGQMRYDLPVGMGGGLVGGVIALVARGDMGVNIVLSLLGASLSLFVAYLATIGLAEGE